MNRYYSYKTSLRKKKTRYKFFLTTVVVLVILFSGYFLSKKGKLSHIIIDALKIKEFSIDYNDSTIPNDVIYKECHDYLNNIFRIPSCIQKLKNKFAEIQQVKIKWFPTKSVKIKIVSAVPIWYVYSNEGMKFLSSNFRWFNVYDPGKICLDRLTEYKCDNWTQETLKLAQRVYKKFKNIKSDVKLTKIYVKQNMECIVTIANKETEQKIVVDENINDVTDEILDKIVNLSLQQKVNAYTRLLYQGRIYIE